MFDVIPGTVNTQCDIASETGQRISGRTVIEDDEVC